MSTPSLQDSIDVVLAALAPLDPNPSHAEAVRRRCRAHLAHRAVGVHRPDLVGGSSTGLAVPVLLSIFAAFYAAVLLSTTLRIEGWLW